MNALPEIDAVSVDTTTDATPSSERRPFWLLAVAAAVFGLTWPGSRSPLTDMVAELVMIVLLYLAVVRTSAFKEWWLDVPRSARRRGKFVVIALVAAQFFSIASTAFPVTQWTMYTRPTVDVAVAYEIVGYTDTGDEVRFVPSMTNRTMSTKMATASVRVLSEQLLEARLDPSDPEQLAETSQELEHVIDLLAGLHNQSSSDSTVVEVVVLRSTFNPEQRRAAQGETEAIWHQEVEMP